MNDRLIESIDFYCPNCNKIVTVPIDSIGESVVCPHCNQIFETDDNEVAEIIEDVENRVTDFLENLF